MNQNKENMIIVRMGKLILKRQRDKESKIKIRRRDK